jgi:UDP-N-acetylglucosamine 2-epimerase (non-hydrolysing)
MPEEKCRTVIDNLSDVIYTYFPEYKLQGILEGLAPSRIVVVQNLIVDVLNKYYFPKIEEYGKLAKNYLTEKNIQGDYFIATSHRRENVENQEILQSIIDLFEYVKLPVIFPASYRTQKNIIRFKLRIPPNIIMVDPIGYKLMLALMSQSVAVITDSGTVVEETAVIGVPSVQMRKATERPQTYDIRSSVKFEPGLDSPESVVRKLEIIKSASWQHTLGDGRASQRIVKDLEERLYGTTGVRVTTHAPSQYHLPIERSYRGDGLEQ